MLLSVYDNIAAFFFLVGDRPWNGEPVNNGSTLALIRNFPDPSGKIRLIHGNWANETDQRNTGLELIGQAGFPYCFIVDADELYDSPILARMQQLVVSRPDIGCWYMNWLTYWKSHLYRIDPPEQYTPTVFVRLAGSRFRENRHVDAPTHARIPPQIGICHHMSYARSNAEILRKISTFSHAHEIRPDWYQNVWLRWDADHTLQNIHPCYPEAYRCAVPQPEQLQPQVFKLLPPPDLSSEA